MRSRKQYVSMVWIYKKRRDIMTAKINSWVRAIKRIDNKLKLSQIKTLITAIDRYFVVKIRTKNMDNKHVMARKVFFKYGIESGITGTRLSMELKRNKMAASISRSRFTKSFTTIPENKETYHRFKDYFESNK